MRVPLTSHPNIFQCGSVVIRGVIGWNNVHVSSPVRTNGFASLAVSPFLAKTSELAWNSRHHVYAPEHSAVQFASIDRLCSFYDSLYLLCLIQCSAVATIYRATALTFSHCHPRACVNCEVFDPRPCANVARVMRRRPSQRPTCREGGGLTCRGRGDWSPKPLDP